MSIQTEKEDPTGAAMKVCFPWGMPGLDYTEYILSSPAQDTPFYFLQSVEHPEVFMLLINPFAVYKDYEFDISEETTEQLKIKDEKQVVVFCTVNTSRGIDAITVNLLAPIVVNIEQLLGKQVVLNDKKYSLRTPLTGKEEGR